MTSAFNVIQRQHSTVVINFEIYLMVDKQALLLSRKRAVLILRADIEKFRHHCSLDFVVFFRHF